MYRTKQISTTMIRSAALLLIAEHVDAVDFISKVEEATGVSNPLIVVVPLTLLVIGIALSFSSKEENPNGAVVPPSLYDAAHTRRFKRMVRSDSSPASLRAR